ncbi:hypothetical protein GCM10011395_11300 [Sphingomonas psychrolutea]|uniref:Uncharacterized protein n=1 Tax=Sphingomonas psychrolutea TaxID=1259676 RepID=A0ABQ1GFR2_9SPHN|nr:hypothetical protein GCM10011395_11300 [Sphingomonas psychrolutea]
MVSMANKTSEGIGLRIDQAEILRKLMRAPWGVRCGKRYRGARRASGVMLGTLKRGASLDSRQLV